MNILLYIIPVLLVPVISSGFSFHRTQEFAVPVTNFQLKIKQKFAQFNQIERKNIKTVLFELLTALQEVQQEFKIIEENYNKDKKDSNKKFNPWGGR